MAIDLRQFHQTFFDESLEGVAEMESELLKIEAGAGGRRNTDTFEADREALNTIFRAAHSIKGGASTFGFTAISEFSHVLETVLDDLREGRIEKNRGVLTALMRSVDCLRGLLHGARDGSEVDTALVASVREALETVHEAGTGAHADRRQAPRVAASAPKISESGWRIDFRPHENLFLTGNDPLRIFRELASHGTLRATVSTSGLPEWAKLDPANCHLSWVLELEGRVARDAVSEAFSWVESDCDLRIEPLVSSKAEAAAKAAETAAAGAQQSIRVSLPKIDALVDLVGELVITQTMLSRYQSGIATHDLGKLQDTLVQLERNTRDLQESVMRIRMLPIGFAFNRLPRIVRDLSQQLGKQVDLRIFGEQTELDKTVIERIGDPLMHLVRNCMDHGIETPAEREAAGKPGTAVLRIEAYQKSGNVFIEIEDDGRGLVHDKILAKAVERGLVARDATLTPEQISDLIFLPGFSTAESVTGVSGRGVGMDVVRSNMQSLGGGVELSSHAGVGTRFTLRLPLTLAIIDGLIVKVGTQTYITPLLSVVESVSLPRERVSRPAGGGEVFDYHGGEVLPILRLHQVFGIAEAVTAVERGIVVIVEIDGRKVGLLVDQLIGQQQVVVKSLDSHYRRVDGIAAATILGDGEVVLVLDIATLVRLTGERKNAA